MIQCDDCLEALHWLYIIIWTESSDKTINNILCEVRFLTNDGLQDIWRVNDVCYYYFNPTELNPCTLYKVLEFVMVEGNFNLVGGDKGIRNTIMVRYTDTEWYIYSQWRQLELLTGPGVTWIRGGKHSLPPHCWLFVYLSSALGKGGSWGATQELEFIAGLILNT